MGRGLGGGVKGYTMSRHHYSSEQRQHALAQIAANGDNVPLTSVQLGIPERTLYKWRLRAQRLASPPPMPLTEGTAPPSALPKLSENDTQALRALKRIMLENAYDLAHEIRPSIPHST